MSTRDPTPTLSFLILQQVKNRGFVDLISSSEKTAADKMVLEGELTFVSSLPNGGKRYKEGPPKKEKKSITCKGCGLSFKAWTAGKCGKCKK